MISAENVKPLSNYVLIKRSTSQKAAGKILLPQSAQEKPKEGTVLALGPGKKDKKGTYQPISLKEGQTVLFSSYAGKEFESRDDQEYLLIAEDDILGIIEEV